MENENVQQVEEGEILDDDTGGSSIDIQMNMNATLGLNDEELAKRTIVFQLQQKYVYSYILRRVNYCPASRCNNYTVSWDIVAHFLEAHQTIPRFIIELENGYEIPLELQQLEYGRNKIIAIMLFPITKESGTPSDHSTMPIAIMAAKIHPCGNLQYVESHTAPSNSEDKPLNDGDLLMIWVCGHVQAVRTVLKLTSALETGRYVYSGCIHHLAENNHHPHMVFARGNCLLVPATNVTSLTDNGRVPLDLSIKILVEEEEL